MNFKNHKINQGIFQSLFLIVSVYFVLGCGQFSQKNGKKQFAELVQDIFKPNVSSWKENFANNKKHKSINDLVIYKTPTINFGEDKEAIYQIYGKCFIGSESQITGPLRKYVSKLENKKKFIDHDRYYYDPSNNIPEGVLDIRTTHQENENYNEKNTSVFLTFILAKIYKNKDQSQHFIKCESVRLIDFYLGDYYKSMKKSKIMEIVHLVKDSLGYRWLKNILNRHEIGLTYFIDMSVKIGRLVKKEKIIIFDYAQLLINNLYYQTVFTWPLFQKNNMHISPYSKLGFVPNFKKIFLYGNKCYDSESLEDKIYTINRNNRFHLKKKDINDLSKDINIIKRLEFRNFLKLLNAEDKKYFDSKYTYKKNDTLYQVLDINWKMFCNHQRDNNIREDFILLLAKLFKLPTQKKLTHIYYYRKYLFEYHNKEFKKYISNNREWKNNHAIIKNRIKQIEKYENLIYCQLTKNEQDIDEFKKRKEVLVIKNMIDSYSKNNNLEDLKKIYTTFVKYLKKVSALEILAKEVYIKEYKSKVLYDEKIESKMENIKIIPEKRINLIFQQNKNNREENESLMSLSNTNYFVQNEQNTDTVNKIKEWPCDQVRCDKIYQTWPDLHNHIETHKNSSFLRKADPIFPKKKYNQQRFKCQFSGCNKTYKTKYILNAHMNIHNNKFICKECNYCAKSSYDLKEHQRKHTTEKLFQCNLCTKSFSSQKYLNQHLEIHNKVKDFKCKICKKYFSCKRNLKRHKQIHTGEKLFQCHLCTKSFITHDHLKSHIAYHLDIRSFECDQCTKSFKTKSNLDQHKRYKHSK